MSYDRYLKYSQAKTVAQALEFGSLLKDLLNDYEKGLLKRVGGPVRDKPIRMADVDDPSKLTKTHLMFAKWSRYLDDEGGAGAEPAADGAGADPAQVALAKLKNMQAVAKDQMSTKLKAMRAGGSTSGAASGSAIAAAGTPSVTTRTQQSKGDSG